MPPSFCSRCACLVLAGISELSKPPGPRRLPSLALSKSGGSRHELARQGYPVNVRAVVTYFDVGEGTLFVQDQSAGIWIDWRLGMPNVAIGDLLDLTGITTRQISLPICPSHPGR